MNQAASDFLLCANRKFLEIWKDAKEDTTKASKKLVEIINGIIKEQDLPMPATGNDHLFKKDKRNERTARTLTILNGEYNLSPFIFWAIFFTYKGKTIKKQRETVLGHLIETLAATYKDSKDKIITDLEADGRTKVLEQWFIQTPKLLDYATQCWKLFEALMQDNPDKGEISKYIRKNDKGILDCKNIGIDSVDNILLFIRPDLKFDFDNNGNITSITKTEEVNMEETIKLLESSKQIILTGAPGTGKTYHATKVAEKMVEEAGGGEYKKVQFHPGYDYSDFIIGLKPKVVEGGQVTFDWEKGVFKEFADKALEAYKQAEKTAKEQKEQAEKTKDEEIKAKPYIFIIDEINRADLSRVFGEVFSLLEEDYRYPNKGKGITLPSKANFILPPNLYIIGTMNDIDRSVESMDFALRRRFSWKEVTAESSVSIIYAKDKNDNPKIANENHRFALQRAMKELNKYIGGEELPIDEKQEQKVSLNLGIEYQLGGAYFLNFSKYQKESNPFELLWSNHIAIILNEYLRGRSNREQILTALKDKYDNAWKGNGSNNDGKIDKKKDDSGNPTADSTPAQPKAKRGKPMIRLHDNRFDSFARKFNEQGDELIFKDDEKDSLKNGKEVLALLKKYSGKTLAKLRDESNGNLITLGRVKKESEDDPAFFTLTGSGNEYALHTSNLMGVLRLRDSENGTSVQIEVHSRFDNKGNNQLFLNYLLSKVFRVDFMGSAAMGNDRLWDILTAILFIQKLKAAVPVGLYKEYKRFEENDLNFRGRLDLARHLRQNYPLQDKIAYSYRAITFDNPVNHLLRSAVEVIQRKYPELLYSDNEIKNFVSVLKNATPTWTKACNRDLLRAPVCRESLRHPFFAEYYEEPRSLAKMILEEEGYSIYDKACEDEVSGVIFDGAWLWEEYISTILTPLGFVHADPDSKINGKQIFEGEEQMGQENIYPDFYWEEKKIVLDTKYKMNTEKREDIFQVLSYALITGSTHCGLIFPPAEKKESFCCKNVGVKNGFEQNIQWYSIAFSELKGEIVGFMQKQEEDLRNAIKRMGKMNVLDFFSAVSEGDLEKVKEFYANGGKVDLNHNLTYACGATWLLPLPLVTAFQKEYDDIAKFLIEKGADPDAYCKKNNITSREVKR